MSGHSWESLARSGPTEFADDGSNSSSVSSIASTGVPTLHDRFALLPEPLISGRLRSPSPIATLLVAETHAMTNVTTAEVSSVQGSPPDPLRIEVDALKQEIVDLTEKFRYVQKRLEDLEKTKVEPTALAVPITKIEVKEEPSEPDLRNITEETPTEQEGSPDNERAEAEHVEQALTETEGVQADTPQNAGDTDERITSMPPRRQSTEEPEWTISPRADVLFKPNQDYVSRTAGTNQIIAEHIRVPTPPHEPQEDDPPPPPSLRPIAALPGNPFGIIPASQMKRKRNFEIVITTPAKRFRSSHYPELRTSEDRLAPSSRSDTMDRRLPRTPFKVTLDPGILNVTVTRQFITAHFGGRSCRTHSQPPPNRIAVHGYDHFVFAKKNFSPQAPSVPGAPGLITRFRENQWPDLCFYRLFVRIDDANDKWQYMGLYKATKLSAWSPDEIKQRRVRLSSYWAWMVKSSTWARPMIARIMLRQKLGREPTGPEVETQVQKIKKKSVGLPSTKTIVEAFENGDEKLHPWKVECKDYEEDLQWEIAVSYPHYKEPGFPENKTAR